MEGRASHSDDLLGGQLVFSEDPAEWCRNTASYPQIKINALFYCRDVLFDYFRSEMEENFGQSGGFGGIYARRCLASVGESDSHGNMIIGMIASSLKKQGVISTEVVEGAKRRDHAAEKSCDDCSTSYLTTILIRCVGQQSLISYVVKRMVYRESQDFSAPSLNICCGSFGDLQIPKDSGRNDKCFDPAKSPINTKRNTHHEN